MWTLHKIHKDPAKNHKDPAQKSEGLCKKVGFCRCRYSPSSTISCASPQRRCGGRPAALAAGIWQEVPARGAGTAAGQKPSTTQTFLPAAEVYSNIMYIDRDKWLPSSATDGSCAVVCKVAVCCPLQSCTNRQQSCHWLLKTSYGCTRS